MMCRGLVLAALGSVLLASALSGCTTGDSADSCENVFRGLSPASNDTSGLFFLVSEEIANTLDSCTTVESWTDALTRHPDVVGQESISADDALEYLASSCALLPSGGESNPVCSEARETDLID